MSQMVEYVQTDQFWAGFVWGWIFALLAAFVLLPRR